MAKKRDTEVEASEALENEGEARVYELGFHLDPELPTEGVKKAYQAVRAMIESHGAIVAEGEPVMIQLAYTISRQDTTGRRDFNSAYFCWIAYEATTESHDEVLAAVRENKNIVRYIDLTTTKEAARHSVEIREFTAATKGKEEDAEEAEAVADAELDAALQSATI